MAKWGKKHWKNLLFHPVCSTQTPYFQTCILKFQFAPTYSRSR